MPSQSKAIDSGRRGAAQDPLAELGRMIGHAAERQGATGVSYREPLTELLHIAEDVRIQRPGLRRPSSDGQARPLRDISVLFENALRRGVLMSEHDYVPCFKDAFYERPFFKSDDYRLRRAARIVCRE